MSARQKFEDLAHVEIEHMIGLGSGLALVKFRCTSEHTVMLGQLEPAAAREIARNLFEAAARAEYELDLLTELQRIGVEEDAIATIFQAVRAGEERRMS